MPVWVLAMPWNVSIIDSWWIVSSHFLLTQTNSVSRFDEVNSLKEHMRTHTPEFDARLKLQCRICQKSYVEKILEDLHSSKIISFCWLNRFRGHRSYRAHCKYQKKNRCEGCTQVFCTVAELSTHREQDCDQIIEMGSAADADPQYRYLSDDELEEDTDTRVECHICGSILSNNSNLRYHQRTVHDFKDLYKCNECGERFTFKRSLQAHRVTHVKNKKWAFECWLCHKG